MPSPDKITVKAYLTPEEYKALTALAGQARLSISKFVRAACLGVEIKSAVNQEAVLAMLKVNGDLGRLGGLLKMALGEKAIDRKPGNELLEALRETRQILHEKVRAL